MKKITVFVGLDYHQDSVQVCVLDSSGKVLQNGSYENDALKIGTVVENHGTEVHVTVTFADQSSGEVSAWAWDFDSDGTIDSTDPHPTHLFDTPGGYTVTLTVGGPEGRQAGGN